MTRGAPERGFTLVEMMVALLIFGMLAAAGVALLSFSVRAQSATTAKLDDLSALNRLSSSMSADLAQALDRPTRDGQGTTFPAMTSADGAVLLRLARGGWSNLDDAPRPGVQKVAYQLDRGTIERIAYPMLDGAAALPPAPMLSDVRQVALRYRRDGAWSDTWIGTPDMPLPQAVEMVVTRDDGRQYRQLFLVGAGYGLRAPEVANAAP